MPFQIQPIREFLLKPTPPPALERLPELAYNIVWSWESQMRALFRRLDPALWRSSGYNPVEMLSRVAQSTLDKAAADPRYLALYKTACASYDAHMQSLQDRSDGKLIAYFSAEYGLSECMPIYSGGLGILSGDHLKSAADLDLPLVGVGLLYQQGYFRQYLNADGWQQEHYPSNDFYTLPVKKTPHIVTVDLPGAIVYVQVWTLQAGRVQLILLDTNIPQNEKSGNCDITDQLYGGDLDTRIRQEIVLGIGGMRALRALGLQPTVFHMNEGHSAFLALERIREFIQDRGFTFDEALEATRDNNVFTTHTPVPAGIDKFDPGMMYHYFAPYCQAINLPFDQLMTLGRRDPSDGDQRFSMAVLALRTSAYRNAVSELHGHVSREMWSGLWPDLPAWEVPITAVTNGVHLPSWLNSDLAKLYDQYLAPGWRDRAWDPKTWDLVDEIPDEELMEVHRTRKSRLIAFVRQHVEKFENRRKSAASEIQRAQQLLDPNALTIGFARRFATYKRATLILKDPERLKRILCNKERPVQLLIAGKAHPKDQPGKSFIREIVQLSRDPELRNRLVFLEDYDIKVAREMVHGVDVWLNNPIRGEEACGTSGMKAAMNGVLNLSILDGWFDEAYEVSGGWAIGDREHYWNEQDAIHASNIYSLLENEIVPLFYERGSIPGPEWFRRVKLSLKNLSPWFDCRRMVAEYDARLYDPAHAAWTALGANSFGAAKERVARSHHIRNAWDGVRFLSMSSSPEIPVATGQPIRLHAVLDLGGLKPEDVRVEAVVGHINVHGYLENTELTTLSPASDSSSGVLFESEVLPSQTGRLGYSFRVSPNHHDDPLTRPCPALMRWAQ